MISLSQTKLAMIWKKPLPSSPSSASAGTRTSMKESSPVSEAFQPSFFIFLEVSKPGVPRSMMMCDMPL